MEASEALPGMQEAVAELAERRKTPQKLTPHADPRVCRPDRRQMLLEPTCLDDRLPPDQQARTVWAAVEKLDLSKFYEPLAARGSDPGRSATDPRLLVALWLYATIEGVGSGRELERLCREHNAYQWLCGGVSVNYHTLNDFRVDHEGALDQLLTELVAVLAHQQVVQVRRIVHDGTKVRAHANKDTFKAKATLEQLLVDARKRVETLKTMADAPPREKAAQERAARERAGRLEKALTELAKIQATKDQQQDKPSKERAAQASTTDPECRLMKTRQAGFQPCYNVQLAADPVSRGIVGVEVTNACSDANEATPIREQVEQRTGQKVQEQLMDGGFAQLAEIEKAHESGVTVYAPPQKRRSGASRYAPMKGDPPGVAQWRVRMGTPEARTIYKKRDTTIEAINGDLKTFRGLGRIQVRGLHKIRCLALWSALAYNVMHFAAALLG